MHWFKRPRESYTGPISVCEAYDAQHAEEYDMLIFDLEKMHAELDFITPMLTPESRVLDIGCGTGRHVHALCANGVNATGMDKSIDMVKYARQKYPHQFECGNAMSIGTYVPEHFSHILCLYFTAYYMENKNTMFHNMNTWLEPGGLLILHLSKSWKYGPPPSFTRPGVRYKCAYKHPYHRETIHRAHHTKKITHTVYMEPKEAMLNHALRNGFTVHSVYDYLPPYQDQWMYVLQKSAGSF
jgi:SAM-dependent methyltransferase